MTGLIGVDRVAERREDRYLEADERQAHEGLKMQVQISPEDLGTLKRSDYVKNPYGLSEEPQAGEPETPEPNRARSRRGRAVASAIAGTLLVGGGIAAVALKASHDHNHDLTQQRADTRRAVAQALLSERVRQQSAADARARQKYDRQQRAVRHGMIADVERSMTKEARARVRKGTFSGPILYTRCGPDARASADDLTKHVAKFDCLAVNKKRRGGVAKGYTFGIAIDYDDGSYTWHLGP